MTGITYNYKSRALSVVTAVLMSLTVLLGLQACSSSSSPPITPTDANPKGYFSGTAELGPAPTTYTDVIALASNFYDSTTNEELANRVMVFSPSANVLFDITVTEFTSSTFTGTVKVYEGGTITPDTVTVSGTVNNSRILGTFAGATAGLAVGEFSVFIDSANNSPATLARIEGSNNNNPEDRWIGDLYGIDLDTGFLQVEDTGRYVGLDNNDEECVYPADTAKVVVIFNADINIYNFSHDLKAQAVGTCVPTLGYTGFASVIVNNGAIDGRVVFAYTNGSIAIFGIMDKPVI